MRLSKKKKIDIFRNDRHFETYFTLRAPVFDFAYSDWSAVKHETLANVTEYTKKGADYVTYQYPDIKYDDLQKIANTDYTRKIIAEADRVQKCLETPVDSGVPVCGALCFGIDMNDLRRVFFKDDCNQVFLKFYAANGEKKQLAVEPSMDFSHTSTIKTPVSGKIHFSERHKWGVSEDPDKMESIMYAACRSPFTTPDTIEKLIELGFGVVVPNRLPRGGTEGDTSFGSTPLHGVVERLRLAIEKDKNNEEVENCIQIIKLLQQAGANVAATNNFINHQGHPLKMTAKQEFENVKSANPYGYNIAEVDGLLTTKVEKNVTWNSDRDIKNFYDGTKCFDEYGNRWTDDYVNMFHSFGGMSGMGTGARATRAQLVIKPVGKQAVATAAAVKAPAAAASSSPFSKIKAFFVTPPKPAAAVASKVVGKLTSAIADADAIAAAEAKAAAEAEAKAAAAAAPKPAIVAAAAAAAAKQRVSTLIGLDTEHLLYKAQLGEIITRLNKQLGVTDTTTYGWTAYYKDSSDPNGDKPDNPIEKMATKAYPSFSEVMAVALKCFSAKIDVLEYGETETPSVMGAREFKVWVVPMLPSADFVNARMDEIKKMQDTAKNANDVIDAHRDKMTLEKSTGVNTKGLYGPIESILKKDFPLYSDELIMLMAFLHGLHRIDRHNSEWGIGVKDQDKHNVRGELRTRINKELTIQNTIFLMSLNLNFGKGIPKKFGYYGDELSGFIIDTKYKTEQAAQDAINELVQKKHLDAKYFHPYQPYKEIKDEADLWQIVIDSPLVMLSESTSTWMWVSDDGKKWNRFEEDPQKLLEAAFRIGQPKVEYGKMRFDLPGMKETIQDEEKSRSIYRHITGTSVAAVPAAVPAKASATVVPKVAAAAAPGIWKWEADNGGGVWNPFSLAVNKALNSVIEIPRITIVTKNPATQPAKGSETVTWWFDMKNKIQINTTTFSSRNIKREPHIHVKFEKDEFVGNTVDWYLGDVKSAEQTSDDIEKQYQANKTATSVTIGENTFNFATMISSKGGAENVLTRVCRNPPRFTDVEGKALHILSSKPSGMLTVDQFCKMVWEANSTEKINIALTEIRLNLHNKFAADPNGNTGLYCACRAHHTTVNSIRRLVEELGLDVNLQNSVNKSTPLHGLVERLKNAAEAKIKASASSSAASATSASAAFSSEYDNIHAIMQFLVTEKTANVNLQNLIEGGGTALQEFNIFKNKDGGLSTNQQAAITALLTPGGAAASAPAKVIAPAPKVATAAAVTPSSAATEVAAQALSKLVTSAYLPALRDVIATQFAQVKDMSTKSGNDTWAHYISSVMDKIKPLTDNINAQTKELKATTVGAIDAEYVKIVQTVPTGSKASFTIVGPFIDGKYALKSNLARNSIVQVASQFDFLESPSPEYTEITLYPWDPTQGPGSSMASLEALILRDAAIKPPTPDGELQPLGQQPIFDSFKQQNWYKNGYLTPHRVKSEPDLLKAAKSITDNIGTLKILAQESIPEFGKGPCIQVFSAAPSYQAESKQLEPPVEGSAGAQICEDLVLAQYVSIAKLAVMKSIADPSQRVNLHLTAVGQGVFNNPPSLYDKFITAVWEIVKPFNVSVYMHVYGAIIKRADGSINWDENNPVFVDKVAKINKHFEKLYKDAKTASGKLPQLSAEQFIDHA